MATVFLLQNQHKSLLNKQGEWCDGREAASLFRTVHHDEALNQMIETNARDYTLRIKILECETNDRGLPLLKDEDLPPLGEAGTTLESDGEDTSVAAIDAADQQSAEVVESPEAATQVELEAAPESPEAEAEPVPETASLF